MYIKLIDNNPVFYTIEQLRRDNPNDTIPVDVTNETLATTYDIYPVTVLPKPMPEKWQRVIQNSTPTQDANNDWVLDWTIEEIPATVELVKEEANRRIIEICPEWKQRNLIAQASQLAEKGRANWTAEELDAWNAGQSLWIQIAAIRAASDTIESMNPIPNNFYNLPEWP